MESKEVIAERAIYAVDANGDGFEVHLSVGKPYQVSIDEWACPVGLKGIQDRLRDQHGVDSWQALQLSYQLIAQLLGHFVQDGGKLYWSKDGEEISFVDLIPKRPAF